MRPAALLPARLRRFLLALAEVGHETRGDLKLALLADPRATFVDVGANRGQFARFMSSFYDRVVVFEPIRRFGDELRSILAPNCVVHDCALADFDGSATFYVPTDGDPLTVQTASLVAPVSQAARVEVDVEVRRLDSFALDAVSFIKVDIEGAEFAFLRGAAETIERCRPLLLIEIEHRHTGGETRRVFDFLFERGYDAFIREDGGGRRSGAAASRLLRGIGHATFPGRRDLTPVGDRIARIHAAAGDLNRGFGDGYVNNFLFVPRR